MNDHTPPEDWIDEDNLDLDEAINLPDPDAVFRHRVLGRTTAHVRRRRQARHLIQVAALTIAFGGGMATTLLFDRTDSRPEREGGGTFTEAGLARPELPRTTIEDSVDSAPAFEFPAELLRNAEALTLRYNRSTPQEQLRLLKAAGDRAFYADLDLDLAARFYRRYIEGLGSDADSLIIDPANWLFASVSTALQEEIPHETPS